MIRRFLFDNSRKCAVVSDHGWYRMYHVAVDDTQQCVVGELIQVGDTDELGFIYNFVGDTLFLDPRGFSDEEIERRLSALCGKSEKERHQIKKHERELCAKNHFGITLSGRWHDLSVFES